MAQSTSIAVAVVLFEVPSPGAPPVDRGHCLCAIVGQPAPVVRYKLVCYNDQRQTLSVATITSSNDHSLQFAMQTAEYASFRDDSGNTFNIMFLKSADVEPFLGHLGVAFYACAGQPSHSATIADLAHSRQRGKPSLSIGQRAKVRFHAFSFVTSRDTTQTLPKLEALSETNGDMNYAFDCLQSSYALLPDSKGFESSVSGMLEEAYRIVVVPEGLPRSSGSLSANRAFVIHLVRAMPKDLGPTPTAGEGRLVVVSTDIAPPFVVSDPAPSVVPRATHVDVAAAAAASASGSGPGLGSGVPAEHMLFVQKVAAQINTAASTLRDLQDKVGSFSMEWQQSVNRPKPSLLTSAALDQGVKQLIADHDKLKEELNRREEIIRALDERNVDLQRRVDKAAQVAQQLMDEKKTAVTSTSDSRLEIERQVMKVQEGIGRVTAERDDLTRHLQTVKKLLDMSDADLRDVRGKGEVLKVSAVAVTNKLDAAEERLGEERSRRKALESKVAALGEEIRNAHAEIHQKAALLDDLRRQADADRVHYGQLMEDERQRRALETAQLRSEIVNELHQREQKFLADRARVAEDQWARGHDEGKEIGRRDARIDLEHKTQELLLEAQRTKTELDAYKTQLRSLQDDSMAENRRLEAIVLALKKNTEEVAREKAQREFELQAAQMRVRSAEDSLLLALTSAAHRLTRPATATDLLTILEALRQGGRVDFGFESAHQVVEREAALSRRTQWMQDELYQRYEEVLAGTMTSEWTVPLNAGKRFLNETVADLWLRRDAADAAAVVAQEEEARNLIAQEEPLDFAVIEELYRREAEERRVVEEEAVESRIQIEAPALEFFTELAAWYEAQREERAAMEGEHETSLAAGEESVPAEEHVQRAQLMASIEQIIFAEVIAAQQAVISSEEEPRSVEADEEAAAWDALTTEAEESFRSATERQEWRLAKEASDAAEIASLDAEEAANRESIANEETADSEPIEAEYIVSIKAYQEAERERREEEERRAKELEAQLAAERAVEERAEAEAREAAEQEESIERDVAERGAAAERDEALQRQATREQEEEAARRAEALRLFEEQQRAEAEASAAAAREAEAAAIRAAAPQAQPRAAMDTQPPSTSNGAAAAPPAPSAADPLGFGGGARIVESKSDSDEDEPSWARPPPKPAVSQRASTGAPAPPAKLFGSDDSDDEPAPPPRPLAKKAPAPKAAAKLFDSDDD